jgi:molybdopterin synthase catalytic subunit
MPHTIEIGSAPLSSEVALRCCAAPAFGAVSLFVGQVREENDDRPVNAVSYELHERLCRSVFSAICEEAEHQWGDTMKLYMAHRSGRLAIGEASVIIAAGSPHRNEAFSACRYMIEQMKQRAPIWKQEHYVEGDSEWLRGHALCSDG